MGDIADERYVSVTTFTKDGRPKKAPVWIASLGDGAVGFTTGAATWKLKRIEHTPRVELQACDLRGNVTEGSPVATGAARVVRGDDVEPVMAAIRAKYGWQVPAARFAERIRGLFGGDKAGADCGVIIRLD